jgi:hypothetical protein
MSRAVIALLLMFAATAACGQTGSDPIPWQTDPQRAVQMAQAANLPLMVYVLPPDRERKREVEKTENEQERALRDPAVLRLVPKFIPLRLSRGVHRERVKEFGFTEASGYEIRFVSPDGQVLGAMAPGEIGAASIVVLRMEAAYDAHVKRLYAQQVKPKLDDKAASPEDLKAALKLVSRFNMTMADQSIAALLDRERLDAGLRGTIYETLAGLATKNAIAKLLERARANDTAAIKALEKTTPVGAELLLPELKADAEPFDYLVYRIVTKVCNVKYVKPEKFFQEGDARRKAEEVARVAEAVKAAAEKWKAEHE